MSYIFGLGDWKIQKEDGTILSYSDFNNSVVREPESFDEKIIKYYGLDASIQSDNRGFYYSAELEFWNLTEDQYNLLLPLQGTTLTFYPSELDLTNGFPVFVKYFPYLKNQQNSNFNQLLKLEGQELTDYGLGLYCNSTIIYCNSTNYYCNGEAV